MSQEQSKPTPRSEGGRCFYSRELDEFCLSALKRGCVRVDAEAGQVFSGRTGALIGRGLSTRGYRVVTIHVDGQRRQVKVHRLVWLSVRGPVPDGQLIDHENRIKADCRFSNLRLVTPSGNAINRRSSHGEASPHAKLRARDAEAIRTRHLTIRSYSAVAAEFAVSKSLVAKIVRGELWNR